MAGTANLYQISSPAKCMKFPSSPSVGAFTSSTIHSASSVYLGGPRLAAAPSAVDTCTRGSLRTESSPCSSSSSKNLNFSNGGHDMGAVKRCVLWSSNSPQIYVWPYLLKLPTVKLSLLSGECAESSSPSSVYAQRCFIYYCCVSQLWQIQRGVRMTL